MAKTQTSGATSLNKQKNPEDATIDVPQTIDLLSVIEETMRHVSTPVDSKEVAKVLEILFQEIKDDPTLFVDGNVLTTIEEVIAKIDQKLSCAIDSILHQEDFKQLESAWRGLYHLYNSVDVGDGVEIKVLNVSKDELRQNLHIYAGEAAYEQSRLFKLLYEKEFDQYGGQPFSCLISDYTFNHTPPDVEMLNELARIGAYSHCPFIGAAKSDIFGMQSWFELADPKDLASRLDTPAHIEWKALRRSDNSRYLGLTMPQFVARHPYGRDNPVKRFTYQENVRSPVDLLWANAAFAFGANVAKSFKEHGIAHRITGVQSGGLVENLPIPCFTTGDDLEDYGIPVESHISGARANEIAKLGFIPLIAKKNDNVAVFLSAQSVQEPTIYDKTDATASARIMARLPYIFTLSSFSHTLKILLHDCISRYWERADLEKFLNRWINRYVHGAPQHATELEKIEKPLAYARIDVTEVEDDPGFYRAELRLRPFFQFEGLDAKLMLVARVRSKKSEK